MERREKSKTLAREIEVFKWLVVNDAMCRELDYYVMCCD
jgi:hypothetical protein